jgi:hypothetical protein
VLIASSGCDEPSSLTSPSDASTTLTGHVTATNGGQPLPGLRVDLGSHTAGTNANGGFAVAGVANGSRRVSLTGPTIIPRSLVVAVGSTSDLALDAISLEGFDLDFYRQFVRNGFDSPDALEPLRRWTMNPNIYLKTVDASGAPIDRSTLDMVQRIAFEVIPVWTNNQLVLGAFERGTGTRVGMAGWITIAWSAALVNPNQCGRAMVAAGYIELEAHNPRCTVGSWITSASLVRHELGHAMGYWHTNAPSDVMSATSWISSDQRPSARERSHAAIAYARPVGNTDPDSDPSGVLSLAPSRMVH